MVLSGVEGPQLWYLSRHFVFVWLVCFAAVLPDESNPNFYWL